MRGGRVRTARLIHVLWHGRKGDVFVRKMIIEHVSWRIAMFSSSHRPRHCTRRVPDFFFTFIHDNSSVGIIQNVAHPLLTSTGKTRLQTGKGHTCCPRFLQRQRLLTATHAPCRGITSTPAFFVCACVLGLVSFLYGLAFSHFFLVVRFCSVCKQQTGAPQCCGACTRFSCFAPHPPLLSLSLCVYVCVWRL